MAPESIIAEGWMWTLECIVVGIELGVVTVIVAVVIVVADVLEVEVEVEPALLLVGAGPPKTAFSPIMHPSPIVRGLCIERR